MLVINNRADIGILADWYADHRMFDLEEQCRHYLLIPLKHNCSEWFGSVSGTREGHRQFSWTGSGTWSYFMTKFPTGRRYRSSLTGCRTGFQ